MGKILDSLSRRFLITAFAVVAAVSARGQTQPNTPPGNTVETGAEASAVKTDTTIAYIENMSNDDLSAADDILIEDAKKNFIHLLPYMQNNYSAELKKLQDSTNSYLGRYGIPGQKIVIFDPVKFDVIKGLSLDKDSIAGEILRKEINQEPPSTISTSTNSMGVAYSLPMGYRIYMEAAHACYHEAPNGASVLTIVPIAPHALPYNIEGLTLEENVIFANKHEAWHCVDFLLSITDQSFSKLPDALVQEGYRAHFNRGDAKSLIIEHNREAFADVAALGEMIREGKNMNIIDAVIKWRLSFSKEEPDLAGDISHFSVMALQKLKERINDMGIENFRKLDESDAREMYTNIAIDKGLTPRLLRKYTGYEKNNRTAPIKDLNTGIEKLDRTAGKVVRLYKSLRRFMFKTEKLVNRETKDMFEFRDFFAERKSTDYLPLTKEQEAEVDSLLMEFSPQKFLYDRAMQDYGKITPITLIKTYGLLQDEMLQSISRDPSMVNYITTAAKMAELQKEFINKLDTEDYLLLNAEKGVDLFKTEFNLAPLAPKIPGNTYPDVIIQVPVVKTP